MWLQEAPLYPLTIKAAINFNKSKGGPNGHLEKVASPQKVQHTTIQACTNSIQLGLKLPLHQRQAPVELHIIMPATKTLALPPSTESHSLACEDWIQFLDHMRNLWATRILQ